MTYLCTIMNLILDDVENEIDQSSRKWKGGYCSYKKCCPYKPSKNVKCLQKVSGRRCKGNRPGEIGNPMCRPDSNSGCKCGCNTTWPDWGRCYCYRPNPHCEKNPCKNC